MKKLIWITFLIIIVSNAICFGSEKEELINRIPDLIAKLETAKGEVKWRIIRDLGRSGDDRGVDSLSKIIKNGAESIEYKKIAIEAFGLGGNKKAIPILKETLNISNDELKYKTVISLYQLGEKDVLPLMEKYAEQGKSEVLHCFTYVSENGKIIYDQQANPFYKKALNYENNSVRILAARYLYDIDHKNKTLIYPIIKGVVKVGNNREKSKAIDILQQIGDETAIKMLSEIKEDNDKNIREKAKSALSKIKNK